MTRSFPQISDLPNVLTADEWKWEKHVTPTGIYKFWVGTNLQGKQWMVKMRGSVYAFRERVFGALAQRLGLSCQTSVYLILPKDCPPMQEAQSAERYQLALWLLQEHKPGPCSKECPKEQLYKNLNDPALDRASVLLTSKVLYAIDMAKCNIMVYLCGANEPSGELFTQAHEFVQIDNELMFLTHPCDIWQCEWLKSPDGGISEKGLQIATDLCPIFAEVTDSEIESICDVPPGYLVNELPPIKPLIYEARNSAKNFKNLKSYKF